MDTRRKLELMDQQQKNIHEETHQSRNKEEKQSKEKKKTKEWKPWNNREKYKYEGDQHEEEPKLNPKENGKQNTDPENTDYMGDAEMQRHEKESKETGGKWSRHSGQSRITQQYRG